MSKLSWYVGRVAAMSPGEIGWRVRQAASRAVPIGERLRVRRGARLVRDIGSWQHALADFRSAAGGTALLDGALAGPVAADRPDDVEGVITAADRIIAGHFRYFGYPEVDCGTRIDWNYDPMSDYHWPKSDSWRIDHRTASVDPKWIWELNRLQHLPILTEAWLFTGNDKYAELVVEHLDSWLEQNPPGTGIAWRGAFEMGIRAISVAVALQGLRDWPGLTTDRFERYANLLDLFAWHCWHGRSLHSSANNHLIGELTGLLTVHLTFPQIRTPAAHFHRALAVLVAEADRQILPDGANAEQSVSYQMFTAELLGIVVALLRLRSIEVPNEIAAALRRSSDYLVGLVGTSDPDPRYGDDDDSFALKLGPEHKRTVRQHLGIIAAVTEDDAVLPYSVPTMAASWIRHAYGNPAAEPRAVQESVDYSRDMYAQDAGLVVLRDSSRRLTMDVGPLGYLSIAAHGHADALSVTLSSDGHELIVDPGTGSYYPHPEWREAHRGTRAHPTVCVDGVNQSVVGGQFLWRQHARVNDVFVDLAAGLVDARHDGYRILEAPVEHRRWLIAPPGATTVAVVDLVSGKGRHHVELSWPLHPELEVTPLSGTMGYRVSRAGIPVLGMFFAATGPASAATARGDTESNLGWWSDRLERRVPAWHVSVAHEGECPVSLLTLLSTDGAAAIGSPEISAAGSVLQASWLEGGVRRELSIDTAGLGAVNLHSAEPATSPD